MPNSAELKFKEIDKSFMVPEPLKGIKAVLLETEMGPYGSTDEVIRSWEQFTKTYGGEVEGMPGPTLARRALKRGTQLRVVKVGHYNAGVLSATKATLNSGTAPFAEVEDSEGTKKQAFNLTPKYEGEAYNNLEVQINPASNGENDYFDLVITFTGKQGMDEVYRNLKITDNKVNDYLNRVELESRLVDVSYLDISDLVGQVRPSDGQWEFENGSNGDPVVADDYIGDDQYYTGFHALDNYDDFYEIAVLGKTDNAIHTAGANYVDAREDAIYIAYLPNNLRTASDIIAARKATNIDSKNVEFYAGGLKVRDTQGNIEEIDATGDILGLAAYTDFNYGEWFSKAGPQRGVIPDALGVVNNFGSIGRKADLQALANHQINVVINRNGKTMLWGNFTAQLALSGKSYASIRKLSLYIQKALRPVCESIIEEPNEPGTWLGLFQQVSPFLDSLTKEKRALFSYTWAGDQYANSLDELQINNELDVRNGKYVVDLSITEINSLQDFTINIISTAAGITMTDNL